MGTLYAGFVPVRKKGKLPYDTFEVTYDLEYGEDTLTIHQDDFPKGSRVLLCDDLLATGGTLAATIELVEKAGGDCCRHCPLNRTHRTQWAREDAEFTNLFWVFEF